MMREIKKVLIVGLGNPGSSYETTRHNIGHVIVAAFAKDHGLVFEENAKVKGRVAKGTIHGVEVYLLQPTTFMNNSGLAVQKALQAFGIDVGSLLVITDDIYTEFGRLRFREVGSSGGHNGLKSVEAHLLSQEYQRLRIGIGDRFIGSLEEYVLSSFNESELNQIPEIIGRAKAALNFWISGDIERAREFASKGPPKMQGEME